MPSYPPTRLVYLGIVLLSLGLVAGACELDAPATTAEAETPVFTHRPIEVTYPRVYRDTTQVDTLHGTAVADPYRWLENENEPARNRWVEVQQGLTADYLKAIPYREAIRKRQAEIWDYERYGLPVFKGNRYYFSHNDGLQNQDVIEMTEDLTETAVPLLDPNQMTDAGTAAPSDYSFSGDGRRLGFQVSSEGSDWQQIRVMDTESRQLLPDRVDWVKFSTIAWWRDGFFYSRYPAPDSAQALTAVNEFHQLYYHRLGTPTAQDELIFADRRNPRRNVAATTTLDERFLLVEVSESTSGNALYLRDLTADDAGLVPLIESFDHDNTPVAVDGDRILVLTNDGAPNGRLVRISSRRPERNYWEEILPASADVLQTVDRVGDRLIATYLRDATARLVIYDLDGAELKEIQMPTLGTITGVTAGRSNEFFFGFTTFTWPEVIYRVSLNDFSSSIWRRPSLNFASDDYEVKQAFYESYDKERIPIFIIHKKGLEPDGKRPTLLYGYGGFNISVLPRWNVTKLLLFPAFLENGGVCAVANIRGGGEYGQDWHQAGTVLKKQTVFDDFQAAAEYLMAENYTNPQKMSIYGRSNGGLLVGACITQRPDLYKVAVPAVGVLDMLRYHRFTIGWAWATDYGTVDDPDQFDILRSYSPVHNAIPDKYPATLITTGDHDDRVAPAHSFKFAAALQHNQRGAAPILIRIDPSAGHGAGKSTGKLIDEAADVLSFIFYNLEEGVSYR